MPTAQDKLIGINNYLRLDHVGADVDLSADVVTFSPALQRTMLEANAIGFEVMDVVHGAFDFSVQIEIQNRSNVGLHTVFENYFQGTPPYLMSMVWRASSGTIGTGNKEWYFGGGKCNSVPGPNVGWNSIQNTSMTVRFTEIGIATSDGPTYTSVIDGSTTLTNIADATPA